MAEKEFKKEWENWSKLDRIRFSTDIIFLITFIIILSYWGLFSNEVDILLELFTLKDKTECDFILDDFKIEVGGRNKTINRAQYFEWDGLCN